MYGAGTVISRTYYVSETHDGYYYSGYLNLDRVVNYGKGSTAYYSGYIYGGAATTARIVE